MPNSTDFTLNIDVTVTSSGTPPAYTYSFALGSGSSPAFQNTALFDPSTGNIDLSTLDGDVGITWTMTGTSPGFNANPSNPPLASAPPIQFNPPPLGPTVLPGNRSVYVYVQNGKGTVTRKYTLNDNPAEDDPTIKNR